MRIGVLLLLADLAGTFQSSGDTKFWQDINLKQEPYKENGQYDQYFKHSVPLQPTAEIVQAQEKTLEDVAHEDDTEAPTLAPVVLEEKIDSRRLASRPRIRGTSSAPCRWKRLFAQIRDHIWNSEIRTAALIPLRLIIDHKRTV